jgi:hypothetical protein
MSVSGVTGVGRLWLGAQRMAGSDKWTQLGQGSKEVPARSLNWNAGEPNGPPPERQCVEMQVISSLRHSVWHNDDPCGGQKSFACSYPL